MLLQPGCDDSFGTEETQFVCRELVLRVDLSVTIATANFESPIYLHIPGAYEGKERISHIDTMVISKNKIILADSRAG